MFLKNKIARMQNQNQEYFSQAWNPARRKAAGEQLGEHREVEGSSTSFLPASDTSNSP